MYKKLIAILIVISLLTVSLSSCGVLVESVGASFTSLKDAFLLDKDLRISVKSVEEDKIMYQDNVYYRSPFNPSGSYTSHLDENSYEYLGWSGSRFWDTHYFNGDTKDNPVFLHERSNNLVYFREDYDYKTDSFYVNDTEDIILFSDDLLDTDYENIQLFGREKTDIILKSTYNNCLLLCFYVVIDDNSFYAISGDMKVVYKLSDHFVNILVDNQIVTV